MIMVGQVYSYKKIGNFVITNITEEKISRIWQDGSVDEIGQINKNIEKRKPRKGAFS